MADGIEETGGEGTDPQFQGDGGRDSSSRTWRFRLVDLIVVVVVLAIGVAVLVPAILAGRESQRRRTCLNKAHQIGLALQNYASTYSNTFPPSATVFGTTNPKHVGGYSFLVQLEPFMEYTSCYSQLKAVPYADHNGAMPESNPQFIKEASTSVPEFVCPSNTNSKFQNPTGSPPHFAFTNYKALGASTRDSLAMAANSTLKPPYGSSSSIFPDGMIYPAANNLPLAALIDGASHTIAIVETIDDQNSRWMVGSECTLAGLPQASSKMMKFGGPFSAQPEFDNEFGDSSAVTRAGLRTFLMYDFSPGGADAGKYEDPGWAKAPPAYGPSSMHPAVAIVGMCDGSARALSKRCDAAGLFFLITKNNCDLFPQDQFDP